MKFQRGGFAMGLIVGLLAGLAIALGVALYVTKVPVPFVNKVPQRTAEQDAAEAERNRNWDPNSPLYGKNPARPNMAPPPPRGGGTEPALPPVESPPVAVAPPTVAPPAVAPAPTASPPGARRDPADVLNDRTGAPSTKGGADPFTYFVQVGAYARVEDAEAQRAKVAMMGMAAKVTEREQAGRTVYRVRVGPFEQRHDAESLRDRLDASGMESSLVRVQRQ